MPCSEPIPCCRSCAPVSMAATICTAACRRPMPLWSPCWRRGCRGEAREYLTLANQFVLNVIMAACAVMIGAGDGVADSRMVTAAGGNGVDFGWQLAGAPGVWQTSRRPAARRPAFPARRGEAFPAGDRRQRGDRCLRLWRRGVAIRAGDDRRFARPCTRQTISTQRPARGSSGAHPAFPPDLKLGLDIDASGPVHGVMLAAVDADGEAGLVGRGVAPWPQG